VFVGCRGNSRNDETGQFSSLHKGGSEPMMGEKGRQVSGIIPGRKGQGGRGEYFNDKHKDSTTEGPFLQRPKGGEKKQRHN